MVRSNQGGSVLSFLIIGGVLVALLIGGVYFARTFANDSVVQATGDQKQSNKSDKSDEATTTTKSDDEKEKPQAPTAKPEASNPKPETKPVTPRPAELPQTGPAETLVALLGVGLLTGTATAYYRSRQHRLTL